MVNIHSTLLPFWQIFISTFFYIYLQLVGLENVCFFHLWSFLAIIPLIFMKYQYYQPSSYYSKFSQLMCRMFPLHFDQFLPNTQYREYNTEKSILWYDGSVQHEDYPLKFVKNLLKAKKKLNQKNFVQYFYLLLLQQQWGFYHPL